MDTSSVNAMATTTVRVRSMNASKMALWIFMGTVVMIFVSLTSAYIVKKAEGDWLIFQFPELFKLTSVFIVLSSLSMHFAYISTKKNNLFNIRLGLLITAALAVAFSVGQYMSWSELVDQGVYFVGNPAGSFIYVFTGLHVAHLAGGLIYLLVVLRRAFAYKVHSKSMLGIELCATYWHFLGGLWLYLYIFLIVNN